jgi:hypothetical protein
MEIKIDTVIFNKKKFTFKKKHKEKTYFECKNSFKLKCKATLLLDSALNSFKIITEHNKNCSNLFEVSELKNETMETEKLGTKSIDTLFEDVNKTDMFFINSFSEQNNTNFYKKPSKNINKKITQQEQLIKVIKNKQITELKDKLFHVEQEKHIIENENIKIKEENIKIKKMIENIENHSLSSINNSQLSKNLTSYENTIEIISDLYLNEKNNENLFNEFDNIDFDDNSKNDQNQYFYQAQINYELKLNNVIQKNDKSVHFNDNDLDETREQTLRNNLDSSKQNLISNYTRNSLRLTNKKHNLIREILKFRKPIDLMTTQIFNILTKNLLVYEYFLFPKSFLKIIFQKIEFYKTKSFKKNENFRTFGKKCRCICKKWMFKANFHKHFDLCKNITFEKEFCFDCNRYVVPKTCIDNTMFHAHICIKKKVKKKIQNDSKARWKRRKLGEKNINKRFIRRNIFQQIELNYLRKILSDFVNQRRNDLINRINDIQNGYPEEYLDLYKNETDFPHHFKLYFKKLIGKIGRFYGDTTEKHYFNLEKENQIRKKYELNFKFINSMANEQETKYVQEQIKIHLSTLKKTKIPKFRHVKVYEDLTKTYLLACAERRKIDEELNIAFMQVTKVNSRNYVNFIKFA